MVQKMDGVKKVNVLYLSYDGLTDPLGQSQVLPYLEGLSKKGYAFTIVSFEKKEKLAKEGALIRQLTDRANITWAPLSFTTKPPVLSKIYDRHRMWRTALSLHKKNQYQLIHCRSYVSAEVGLRLKKKFGVKMLFDMRGFWADEKIDNGQWNLTNPLYRAIYKHYKQKEKEFLLNADGIVSLTKAAKDYLLKKPEYSHLKIEVIPCCADLDHFDYRKISDEKKTALRIQLGMPSTAKVVTYVGSFGGWYMSKEMFLFVKQVQNRNSTYFFLFLTKDDPEKVKQEAVNAGLDASKLRIQYVPRQKIPGYLALSDFSLFFIRNTFSKTASSPTKHAELMGMGVPVICNTIGDTGHVISATQTGLLVDRFDEPTLLSAIDQISQVEKIDKVHIRQCAIGLFDLQTGVQKYLSLYKNIIATSHTTHPSVIHA
ncbi:MAG: glycosyltransferase [Chitinophagaceae bacterium]|nr:MAG: glycosyltransferase [Chitinophagaceae bacterium]